MNFEVNSESLIIKKELDKIPVNIPELPLKTKVYIINKEHPLFLEQGIIEDKKHKHYRIKMISRDKGFNGKMIWIPDHWVGMLPKELIVSRSGYSR